MNLTAAQDLKTFLMESVVIFVIYLALYDEMCHHLEDLHDLVSHCFPNEQQICDVTKDPLQCKTDQWV